jgi:quercetin dioxygenase-like cupin family protein
MGQPAEPQNGLARLRELTEQLPPLPVEVVAGNRVDVEVPAGSASGINLLSSPHVSVLTWGMVPGTIFPIHSHNEAEWVIVVLGGFRLRLDGQTRVDRLIRDEQGWIKLAAGDYVFIPPGTVHEAVFDVYTELVSVHIPRSAEYSPCQKMTPARAVTGGNTAGS